MPSFGPFTVRRRYLETLFEFDFLDTTRELPVIRHVGLQLAHSTPSPEEELAMDALVTNEQVAGTKLIREGRRWVLKRM